MRQTRLANIMNVMKEVVGSAAVPSISIAGSTFTAVYADNEKSVAYLDPDGDTCMRCIILDVAPSKSKYYYESKYDPKQIEKIPPTCYSEDGVKPSSNSSKKQCDNCEDCPHNVWGTGMSEMGSRGKACRDFYKIAVALPHFSEEMAFQLRIPPKSLKNFYSYVAQFDEVKKQLDEVATIIYIPRGEVGELQFAPDMLAKEERDFLNDFNGNTHLLVGAIGPERQIEAPKEKRKEEAAFKKQEPKKIAPPSKTVAAKLSIQKAAKIEDDEDGQEDTPSNIPSMRGTRVGKGIKPDIKPAKKGTNVGVENKLARLMGDDIDD